MAASDDTTLNSGRSPVQLAWWLIIGAAIFRLVYTFVYPIQPAGDEAYYWDWGRRPDIGYYSKPPMIAWIYAVADRIGNGTVYGIRLLPIFFGTISAFLLHRLARDLFGARIALIALLFAMAMPAFAILNLYLTIDAPLILFWTGALLCFWRWTESRAAIWLVALCFCLGLGHLTKQMMMVFPVLAVIYLATCPEKRHLLKSVGLWVCIILSFVFLTPPLVWNSQNEWITFTHTSHHFESNAGETQAPFWQRYPINFGTFFGTQLGVLSPITAIFLFIAIFVSFRKFRSLDPKIRYLVIFGGLPIAFMFCMSFRQVMQPNWAAVYYISAIILTAAWISKSTLNPRWQKAALITGFSMIGLVYIIPPILKVADRAGHKILDPTRRTLGYAELGTRVDAIRTAKNIPADAIVVGLGHRDTASELAFHLPVQPRVYRWEKLDVIASQYEMWPNPEEDGLLGKDAIIIRPDVPRLLKRFMAGFESVEQVGEVKIRLSKEFERTFYIFHGKTLKKWPPREAVEK